MRMKAIVEYDGSNFAGFQNQLGQRTVQGVMEEALSRKLAQPISIAGAGRTDSGVHALGQVVSWDCKTSIPQDRLTKVMNSVLPPDVAFKRVDSAEPEFHARFSASSRVYLYLILHSPVSSPLLSRYTALSIEKLNLSAMQEAAIGLLGEKDFSSFTNCLDPGQKTNREVLSCKIGVWGPLILIRIEANAFLRGMVRSIAGTLIEVGSGKRDPESISQLIEARKRSLAGPTAPAKGLCLLRVHYGLRKEYPR